MSDAQETLVNTALQDGVFHIELNRPDAGNAANTLMANQLLDAVRRARTTDGVRVVLISAAGRAFMAGGDLHILAGEPEALKELLGMVNQTMLLLAECEVPVICAVQGLAAGGGLGLALAGDLLVAEDGARFTVGAPAIGLSPDGGVTWQLARWVGMRKAMEMSLLCTVVDAQAALACGLVNEVAPKGELMDLAWKRARQLAAGAQQALIQTKKLLRESARNDLPSQLAYEGRAFEHCMATPDFAEGLAALREKRKPLFA
ncbi:enoyl-CoA hydratase/isomerase family protein [Comamonas thiooxydans]|uniref:enoyl-CoA hydratase/isomerase family protein n=1 Tax=Comamonas thiooxydans TaxID=363952 RepID=UPI00209BF843|nr:enoyl-CoA hydratase-related protein [Comamonas thiooxydans]MCO8251178.1 enoyl-CoA hydratase-related protein [Comamonas thiooxydans]